MAARQHTTFLEQLPFDIINKIFSQLDQRDCIACVGVCHNWYNRVPQYITDIWESVTLSQRHLDAVLDITTSSNTICCLGRCLGSHVKHVELVGFEHELDLYWMMQNLIDWSCDQIETLVLNNCITKDQVAFIQQLHQLASNSSHTCTSSRRLTHLTLKNHRSNVAFLHVLSVCPALTHFTFIPKDSAELIADIFSQEPHVDDTFILANDELQQPRSSSSAAAETATQIANTAARKSTASMDHLIYLHINVLLSTSLRLEPILERCPNIRCFIGASRRMASLYVGCKTDYDASIQLSDLLWYCPKILSYVGNCTYDGDNDNNDDDELEPNSVTLLQQENYQQHSINTSLQQNNRDSGIPHDDDDDDDEEEEGFQHLCISDFPFYLNTSLHLRSPHQQRAIRYLHLTRYQNDTNNNNNNNNIVRQTATTDWSPLFRSLQAMPRLHTLICDQISFSTSSFIALLNACPTIQILHLHSLLQRLGQSTLLQATSSTTTTTTAVRPSSSSSIKLETMPSLRKLCLTCVSFVKLRLHYDNPKEISLAPLLARMPRLETLILKNKTIMTLSGGSDDPEYFVPLRNLKYLEISLSKWPLFNSPPMVTPGLFHYLSQHQQQYSLSSPSTLTPSNNNNNNNNTLTTLKLTRINFTNELLMAIAYVPTLEDLTLSGCYPLGYNDDVDSNGHGSDRVVRDFFNTLGTTAQTLKKLKLGPIMYLSHDTLATLDGEHFPCLQKIMVLPWMTLPITPTLVPDFKREGTLVLPTRISKHGLITLLRKSSNSIRMIMFFTATLFSEEEEEEGRQGLLSSFDPGYVKDSKKKYHETLLRGQEDLKSPFSVHSSDVRKVLKRLVNTKYHGKFSEMETIVIKSRKCGSSKSDSIDKIFE